MATKESPIDHHEMMNTIEALVAIAELYTSRWEEVEVRRVKQKDRNGTSRQVGRRPVYHIGYSERHEWYFVEITTGTYALGRRLMRAFSPVVIEDWNFWSYIHDISCEVMYGFYNAVKTVNDWRERTLQST